MSRTEPVPGPVPGTHSLEMLHCGDGAVLYRARRESSDTPIVLKVLRFRSPAGQQDEVELWRRFSTSQGIESILQHGITSSGLPYLVLQDWPEGSYDLVLARQGPLSVDEAISVGTTVARGLAAVHSHGLLHHAVTPENILRTRFGPALIDFGSVLPAPHPFPPVCHTLRTLQHLPPEALRGAAPTPASDVYRLASTLWTLLAGFPPFSDGPDKLPEVGTYRARLLDAPALPVPRDDVPNWLQDALRQAMSKDPLQRMPSTEEFAAVLRQERPPRPPADETVVTAQWSEVDAATERATQPEPPAPPTVVPVPEESATAADDPWDLLPSANAEVQPEERERETAGSRGEAVAVERPRLPDRRGPQAGGWTGAEDGSRSGGRRVALYALAAVLIAVVAGLGVLVSGVLGGGEPEGAVPAAEASPAPRTEEEQVEPPADLPTEEPEGAAEDLAPTRVEIRDGTISVALSWTDNTGGEAPHYVVGAAEGADPSTMADVAPGDTSVEITGLNPDVEYCFRVVAVRSTDLTAPSEEICTDRVAEQET